MKRKNATRNALFSSIISLLLCVSMLVGTTFAWFTDKVESGVNTIAAGNLDVELEYKKVVNGELAADWTDVKGATTIFDENTLWEPGHVEVAYLKVSNEGSLALKYQLGVNFKDTVIGKTEEGDDIYLSKHLVFAAVEMPDEMTVYSDREAVAVAAGSTKGIVDYNGVTKALDAKGGTNDVDYVALIVYMPTTVENEANYRGTAPKIELGINLYATQVEAESDSFGDDYDEGANHKNFKVTTANDLQAAVENAKNGDTIIFANNVESTDGTIITDKNITIDLNGKTYSVSDGASTNNRVFKINGSSEVIIKNGTLAAGDIAYGTIRTEGTANVILDNMTLSNARGNGLNVKALPGTTVTVNNTVINATLGGGVEAAGGTIILNDTTINQTGAYDWCSAAIGVNGGGKAIVNSGSYTANTAGTWVAYVMNSGGTLEINGGNFIGGNATGIIGADHAAVVKINGGNFNSTGAILNMHNNVGTQPNPVATIAGGTFSADPRVSGGWNGGISMAAGYSVAQNADGTYSVIFPQESFDALIENAQPGETVEIPAGSYTFPASKLEEGMTLECAPGTVFEGKSDLNIKGAAVIGATFENPNDATAAGTINGTFKDCTFTGKNGLRWCYAGETVVFENCVFDGSTYGVHFDGGAKKVVFKNCKISGFNALAGEIELAVFEGCTFVANGRSAYNGINMWGNTEMTNCTFVFDGTAANEWIDLCSGGKYAKFTNCVVTDGKSETPIAEVVSKREISGKLIIDGVNLTSGSADLAEALVSGGNVLLNKDVETEATTTAPYGNKVGFVQNGGVLDGNGKKLSVECYGDDYGIMTSGGTIKNITIQEGCRAVMIMYAQEDVILDNVNIGGDGVLYPINTGEGGAEGVNLIVTNSTLAGWTSYGLIESASFTNVAFEQGTYYNNIYGRVLKPYVNTTLTDCSFVAHMNLDLSSLKQGHKIIIDNCTVNGQALTTDAMTIPTTDAQYDNELFTVDLPSWANSISDCVIFANP